MLVIVALELREGLGINHIAIAIVLENLFYGPSTCPGVEKDQFIYQKAHGMEGIYVIQTEINTQTCIKCFSRRDERGEKGKQIQ